MIKKSLFTILLSIMLSISSYGQFALGDIAFTAYNSDGTTLPTNTGDDAFTFVLLRSVTAGEQITFTENGWFTNLSGLRSGEGTIDFTFGNSYVSGTQITISRVPLAAVDQDGTTAGTVTGTGLSLATGGDSIFAYNTGSVPTLGNEGSFIAAINMTGTWSASGSADSTTSTEKPSVFTAGVNAVSIEPEIDNARFNPSNCGGTDVNSIRNLVNNASNWESNNGPIGYQQTPVACDFRNLLGTNEYTLNSEINIFPNPIKQGNTLYVNNNSQNNIQTIVVYDIVGTRILVKKISNTSSNNSIVFPNNIKPGIYFVKLTDKNNNSVTKKIMIQ